MAEYQSNFTGSVIDTSIRKGQLLPQLGAGDIPEQTWTGINNEVLIGNSSGSADFGLITPNNMSISGSAGNGKLLTCNTLGGLTWGETAKYATYTDASHTSKTIEQRLSELGFNIASGAVTGVGGYLVKEGNFIISSRYNVSSASSGVSTPFFTHL